MITRLKARITCNDVEDHTHKGVDGVSVKYAEKVTLYPVYSDDKSSPNFSYSEATPSGELRLYITNKEAFGKLVKGKTYDIDITETAV